MVKVLLVVVAAAALYVTGQQRTNHTEHRLAAVASDLAGRPVSVSCQSFAAELIDVTSDAGKVDFERGKPADVTHLKRKVCGALDRMRKDVSTPRFDCAASKSRCPKRVHEEIWAATVLAHESMHLAGEIREDVAECEGVQQTAFVARRLGAGKKLARSIANYAWKFVYPETREDYRTRDCFSGGPYDVRPADPAWP